MSSKLSVCLYTVIIDFTIMILLILGCIMTIFYLQINVSKTFPDSCLINSSTTSIAFTTLTTLTSAATTNTEIPITTTVTAAAATTNSEISITTTVTAAAATTNSEISITTTVTAAAATTAPATTAPATTESSQSCVADLDCLGSSVGGISTTDVFQTTQCGPSGACECAPPYSEIAIGPPYRCTFPNGVSGTCTDDIECFGRCQVNQNKCVAN